MPSEDSYSRFRHKGINYSRAKIKWIPDDSIERFPLTRTNLGLVCKIANDHRFRRLPTSVLKSDTLIGFLEAELSYDITKNVKFSDWAKIQAKKNLSDSFDKELKFYQPTPYHVIERREMIFETEDELRQELGRTPFPEETAERFNEKYYPENKEKPSRHITPKHVVDLKFSCKQSIFPIFMDEDYVGANSRKYQDKFEKETEEIETRDLVEKMYRIINGPEFEEMEKTVISMRYGINGYDTNMTHKAISGNVGLSLRDVRRLEKSALEKLKLAFSNDIANK